MLRNYSNKTLWPSASCNNLSEQLICLQREIIKRTNDFTDGWPGSSKQRVYVPRISVHHESKSTRTVWSLLSGPLAYLIGGLNRKLYEKQSVQRF